MAAKIRIDEINTFSAEKYITSYFQPMRISRERKREREEASRKFRDNLLFLFALIATYQSYGDINWKEIKYQYRVELEKTVLMYSRSTPTIKAYIDEKANDFINTTRKQDLSDPYWTSDERATMEAVNEANDVVGYGELQSAIDAGFRYKTWHGMMDMRERASHVAMEGKTIPISDYFHLAGGDLLVPGDWLNCPEESVNCRCSVTYTKGIP